MQACELPQCRQGNGLNGLQHRKEVCNIAKEGAAAPVTRLQIAKASNHMLSTPVPALVFTDPDIRRALSYREHVLRSCIPPPLPKRRETRVRAFHQETAPGTCDHTARSCSVVRATRASANYPATAPTPSSQISDAESRASHAAEIVVTRNNTSPS